MKFYIKIVSKSSLDSWYEVGQIYHVYNSIDSFSRRSYYAFEESENKKKDLFIFRKDCLIVALDKDELKKRQRKELNNIKIKQLMKEMGYNV